MIRCLRMEPVKRNVCSFINFKDAKLKMWRSCLQGYAEVYGHIYIVSDTETTGTAFLDERTKEYHRILEWAAIFAYRDEGGYLQPCKDNAGELIYLDELVNPFISPSFASYKLKRSVREIPLASIEVHGITEGLLFGHKDKLTTRPATGKTAASFDMVYSTLLALVSSEPFYLGEAQVSILFHNAYYDISFINSEAELWGMKYIESYFSVIDTWSLAKDVIPQSDIKGYSLDDCFAFVMDKYPSHVTDINRDLHSAYSDANMLLQTYNGMVRYWKEQGVKAVS